MYFIFIFLLHRISALELVLCLVIKKAQPKDWIARYNYNLSSSSSIQTGFSSLPTCPSCQQNSSWGFIGVKIQQEPDRSFFHAQWGRMGPALLGDTKSKPHQVTSPIFTAKNDHISGYLWEFFQPPRWGTLFLAPGKECYCTWFQQLAPQAAPVDLGEARVGILLCLQPHIHMQHAQQKNAALQGDSQQLCCI